jgi:triacylglycerol lipase
MNYRQATNKTTIIEFREATMIIKIKRIVLTLLLTFFTIGQAQAGWFDWLFPPSHYTKTKYPIVLVGGFLAFDNILGIDYFYRIPNKLREDGAVVYPVNVSAFNGTEARGLQLEAELEHLKATTGYKKFNLIGHSGGATTIRFVAALRPDLVASVTSVHGDNKGVVFADWVQKVSNGLSNSGSAGTAARNTLASLLNTLGSAVELLSGHSPGAFPENSLAMLRDYTTAESVKFNKEYPEGVPSGCGEGAYKVNGVRYYSWGGTSVLTNPADLLDYFFVVTSQFYHEANDGLIGRCSSHLGQVIRDNYRMNHVDAMNHLFGLHGLFSGDPVELYRQQANRLKNAGL